LYTIRLFTTKSLSDSTILPRVRIFVMLFEQKEKTSILSFLRFCYITMKCLTSFRQIRFKNEADIRCMCKVCCPFRIAVINSLYTSRSGRVVKSKKSKNRKCRRIVESEETYYRRIGRVVWRNLYFTIIPV